MTKAKVAQVYAVIAKIKTMVKADEAVPEAEEKKVAEEIKSMDSEQKKLLSEEVQMDESLKPLVSEEVPLAPTLKPEDNQMRDGMKAEEKPAMPAKSGEQPPQLKAEEKPAEAGEMPPQFKKNADKAKEDAKSAEQPPQLKAEEKPVAKPEEKPAPSMSSEDDKKADANEIAPGDTFPMVEDPESQPVAEKPEILMASYKKVKAMKARIAKITKADAYNEAEEKSLASEIEKTMSDEEKKMLSEELKSDEATKEVLKSDEQPPQLKAEEKPPMMADEKPAESDAKPPMMSEQPAEGCDGDMSMSDEDEGKQSPALEAEELEEAMGSEDDKDKDKSEATSYEPLAAVSALGDITVADVCLQRWNENGDNPFYNVTVKGSPLAQIYLLDQPNPEEIRATFVTDAYAEAVKGALAKVGVKETLKSVKARYFATRVNKNALAKAITKKVQAQYDQERKEALVNLRGDLLHCASIVLAGASKNFFADMDNSLKASLYEHMHRAGVYNPVSIIEAAFDQGADKFFEFVLNKSVEYMDMPKQALSEVAKAIGNSSTLTVEEGATNARPQAPSLGAHLAANSLSVQAGVGEVQTGTDIKAIRSRVKLGKKTY